MTRITTDEWLAELRRAEASRPQVMGLSTRELAEAMDCSEKLALIRLRGLMESGLAEYAGTRPGLRLDGRAKYTPVYRLVKRGKVAAKCRKGG